MISLDKNCAVQLTAAGSAAIAVVRLSGPRVATFLQAHFDKPVPAGRCVHGVLRDQERVLDDPVVVTSAEGRIAELSLHGGPWVVRSVLDLARRAGFDLFDAPMLPLSSAAVEGDTEMEREMLAYLPLARTEAAARMLLAQPEAWRYFREQLAGMNDAESARERIRERLNDRSLEYLLCPPRVAIVGAPNVGKSTLANQLFAQERSITADLPGTTRDWVGEIANLDGLAVMLVDTPGVRATDDPIERIAIERSRSEVARADVTVLVLDATRPLEPEQAPLQRAYPDAILVVNKSDQRAVWPIPQGAISTVATAGAGMDALRRWIVSCFVNSIGDTQRARCWTARQREILLRSLENAAELLQV